MATKKATTKQAKKGVRKKAAKTTQKKTAKRAPKKARKKKWSHKIKTDSTHPPPGLFTKDAETIARVMATKKVSPGGVGSGIRMVQMFINRAGKNLDLDQMRELEQAKRKLQAKEKPSRKPARKGSARSR
jgi:tRNA(adenine34) deaminase